jgi:hypothetical protein
MTLEKQKDITEPIRPTTKGEIGELAIALLFIFSANIAPTPNNHHHKATRNKASRHSKAQYAPNDDHQNTL